MHSAKLKTMCSAERFCNVKCLYCKAFGLCQPILKVRQRNRCVEMMGLILPARSSNCALLVAWRYDRPSAARPSCDGKAAPPKHNSHADRQRGTQSPPRQDHLPRDQDGQRRERGSRPGQKHAHLGGGCVSCFRVARARGDRKPR